MIKELFYTIYNLPENRNLWELIKTFVPPVLTIASGWWVLDRTLKNQQKTWKTDFFEKKRQEFYFEFWHKLKELYVMLDFLAERFFSIQENCSDEGFEEDKPNLLKKVDECLNKIEDFYIFYEKFKHYCKNIPEESYNKSDFDKDFVYSLGSVAHQLSNMHVELLNYGRAEFSSRLNKTKNCSHSVKERLIKTKIIDFLENTINPPKKNLLYFLKTNNKDNKKVEVSEENITIREAEENSIVNKKVRTDQELENLLLGKTEETQNES